MTEDPRKKRIAEILASTLELGPEKRKRHLAEKCGDDSELRREVERLLQAEHGATDLLAIREEPPPEPPPEEGARFGDFQIVRELGRGGMGIVFEAEQLSLGRRVALKVLPETFANDRERLALFEKEARCLAKVRSPRVVEIYAVGEEDGKPYIAMEFLEGGTLGARLKALGSVPVSARRGDQLIDGAGERRYLTVVLDLLTQVLEGLGAIHGEGLIHRDIKPDNLILASDGIKIADFGLVKDLVATDVQSTLGVVRGTPLYMSPEQASGNLMGIDHRADIFSVGVLAYELISGQSPFTGRSWQDIARKIITVHPPSLKKLRRRSSRDLSNIVDKALEKNPDNRYQSAANFADDLRRCQKGEPIVHGRPTLQDRWRKGWKMQSPLARAGLVAATLAFAAFLWAFLWLATSIDEWPAAMLHAAFYWPQLAGFCLAVGAASLSLAALFHRSKPRLVPLLTLVMAPVLVVLYAARVDELLASKRLRRVPDTRSGMEREADRIEDVPVPQRSAVDQAILVRIYWETGQREAALDALALLPGFMSLDPAARTTEFFRRVFLPPLSWEGWPTFFGSLEELLGRENLGWCPFDFASRAAEVLYLAADYQRARRYANRAVSGSQVVHDLGFLRPQIEAHVVLARLELSVGRTESAITHAEAAHYAVGGLPGRQPAELLKSGSVLHSAYLAAGRTEAAAALRESLKSLTAAARPWLKDLEGFFEPDR